jgi:hypothetical protein
MNKGAVPLQKNNVSFYNFFTTLHPMQSKIQKKEYKLESSDFDSWKLHNLITNTIRYDIDFLVFSNSFWPLSV